MLSSCTGSVVHPLCTLQSLCRAHSQSFWTARKADGRAVASRHTDYQMDRVLLTLLSDDDGVVRAKLHVVQDDGGESVQAVYTGVLGAHAAAALLATGTSSGTTNHGDGPSIDEQFPDALTPDQRDRIEASRQRALARLANTPNKVLAEQPTSTTTAASSSPDHEAMQNDECPFGHGTCVLRTSSTEKNPGRTFFRCDMPTCRYFRWTNEPRRPPKRSNCFSCGGDGHWARDCPKRQR